MQVIVPAVIMVEGLREQGIGLAQWCTDTAQLLSEVPHSATQT